MANTFETVTRRGRDVTQHLETLCRNSLIKENQYDRTLSSLRKVFESVIEIIEQRPDDPHVQEQMQSVLLDRNAAREFGIISQYMSQDMLQRSKSPFLWRETTLLDIDSFHRLIRDIEIDLRRLLGNAKDEVQNEEIKTLRQDLDKAQNDAKALRQDVKKLQNATRDNSSRLISHEAKMDALEQKFQETKIATQEKDQKVQQQFGQVEGQIKELTGNIDRLRCEFKNEDKNVKKLIESNGNQIKLLTDNVQQLVKISGNGNTQITAGKKARVKVARVKVAR